MGGVMAERTYCDGVILELPHLAASSLIRRGGFNRTTDAT